MILVHFQGKTFNLTVIQVYIPTTDAEETEIDRFYKDLQDLLELTHIHMHTHTHTQSMIGGWNAKVGSQEILREEGAFTS